MTVQTTRRWLQVTTLTATAWVLGFIQPAGAAAPGGLFKPDAILPLMIQVSGASNTPSGQKVWYLEGGRRYADSLYVGPPALAMLAQATGERDLPV
jgi:hypothetical protein